MNPKKLAFHSPSDAAGTADPGKTVLLAPLPDLAAAGETAELVFILDRSGSMQGLEADTIGGFNATVQQQRALPGRAHVTAVLFDDAVETLFQGVDLREVAPLTTREYYVRGCTALLDAMGLTIKAVNRRQKAAGRPDRTIFVITTDGLENASRSFTYDEVRRLVEKRRRKNGWEIIFLGANMDAIATAASLGIADDRAATYLSDAAGTEAMYQGVQCAMEGLRQGLDVTGSWKLGIEEDTARRGSR